MFLGLYNKEKENQHFQNEILIIKVLIEKKN